MDEKPQSDDAAIAWVAERQHGVISADQLLRLGLSRGAIAGRAGRGALRRIHRGVYAPGHVRRDHESRCMAAVLAAGNAAVSHESQLVRLRLLNGHRGPIHVTVRGPRHSRRDLAVHWSADLRGSDVEWRGGIAGTRLVRTFCDVAAAACRSRHAAELLRRAFSRGEHSGSITPRVARLMLERCAGRPGSGPLREVAGELAREDAVTRSELERMLLRLARLSGLPKPLTNVAPLGPGGHEGGEVDAFWPDQRLVVELDSWEFHSNRAAFERDRARDTELTAAGYRVLRFTWRRMTQEPHAVAGQILATLSQATPTRGA